MFKITSLAILGLALSVPTAEAQTQGPIMVITPPSKGGALGVNGLYAIETHCSKGKTDLPPINKPGPWPSVNYAGSHAVVVSNGTVNSAVDLTKLPANIVSVVVPFSVNTAFSSANQWDNRDQCDSSYLIKGPSALFVTSLFSVATTTNPGQVAQAFDNVASIATSLAPVLTGVPLGVNPTKNLGGVGASLTDLQNLITELFPSASTTRQTARALPVGATSVDTAYSHVGITVRPIVSVVSDKNRIYFNDLNTAIGKVPFDTSKGVDAAACSTVPSALAQAGFTSLDDQAYGVGRLAVSKLTSKSDIAQCIGKRLCRVAIGSKMDDILWAGIDTALKPTDSDCKNLEECSNCSQTVQPPWTVGGPAVVWLVGSLGQYTNSSAPPPAVPNKYIAATLEIQDDTSQRLFAGVTSQDSKVFFDFIKAHGFSHFGCYAAVTDPVLSGLYNAMASFVGTKEGSLGNVQFKDAIVMYPVFENGVISKIATSDNPTQILESIGKLDTCAGFKVVPNGTPTPKQS